MTGMDRVKRCWIAAAAALAVAFTGGSRVEARERPKARAIAAAEAVRCAGTGLPLRVPTDGLAPYVELALDGKTGPFLIDYGAGASSVEHGVWAWPDNDPRWRTLFGDPHGQIALTGFTLPGWTGATFNEYDRNVTRAGVGLQHGVVGVDLLFNQTVEFHYADPSRSVVIGGFGKACSTADLAAAGFKRIGQAGHWDSAGGTPDGALNAPVVYVELADASAPTVRLGVAAWAQVDTGYDDQVRAFSIDINQALFDRLAALNPAPVEGATIGVTGCDGSTQQRRTFTTPGRVLRIETETGAEVMRVPQFTFVLKGAAEKCGGIATVATPAAQLGASFLNAFGTTIFDGPAKLVWIKPRP